MISGSPLGGGTATGSPLGGGTRTCSPPGGGMMTGSPLGGSGRDSDPSSGTAPAPDPWSGSSDGGGGGVVLIGLVYPSSHDQTRHPQLSSDQHLTTPGRTPHGALATPRTTAHTGPWSYRTRQPAQDPHLTAHKTLATAHTTGRRHSSADNPAQGPHHTAHDSPHKTLATPHTTGRRHNSADNPAHDLRHTNPTPTRPSQQPVEQPLTARSTPTTPYNPSE
jgi:hypothetical protein